MKKSINLIMAILMLLSTIVATYYGFCFLDATRINMLFLTAFFTAGILGSGYFLQNWKEVNL
jgi:hypothetical protein